VGPAGGTLGALDDEGGAWIRSAFGPVGMLGPVGTLTLCVVGGVNVLNVLKPIGAIGAERTGDLVADLMAGPLGAVGGGTGKSCLGNIRALFMVTICRGAVGGDLALSSGRLSECRGGGGGGSGIGGACAAAAAAKIARGAVGMTFGFSLRLVAVEGFVTALEFVCCASRSALGAFGGTISSCNECERGLGGFVRSVASAGPASGTGRGTCSWTFEGTVVDSCSSRR